jgi:hypothetical protein
MLRLQARVDGDVEAMLGRGVWAHSLHQSIDSHLNQPAHEHAEAGYDDGSLETAPAH